MRVSRNGKVFLRNLGLSDSGSLAREADDGNVSAGASMDGTFPHPYTVANARSFIEGASLLFMKGLEFHFGIFVEGSEELVGACGLKSVDYNEGSCEIGYWIGSSHWGNGYGKEAVALLLHVAFETVGMSRVIAEVMEGNDRSSGLLKALGFAFVERFGKTTEDGREIPAERFSITAEGYVHSDAHVTISR